MKIIRVSTDEFRIICSDYESKMFIDYMSESGMVHKNVIERLKRYGE